LVTILSEFKPDKVSHHSNGIKNLKFMTSVAMNKYTG